MDRLTVDVGGLPALVLLPGWPQSSRAFDAVVDERLPTPRQR